MNQSARQMLAGLPVQMAEGGAVEDPLSAGRRRAIANGNEAGWLQNVASVANKWLANPGTAAEAYDGLVKSGISVKDLTDAGISQDAINKALTVPTSDAQKQVNQAALNSMTSTLAQNPTLASEMGARGAKAIYAQAQQYVANLQQDGLTDAERQQLQRMATAQGWGYSDIRAAGIDPSLLFNQPAPVATTPVNPNPVTPTPVTPSPFPQPEPYTPVTVYDADKFAREQGGEDLYKKGEVALDTAFRSSPVRQVSPTTGQYTYTPAASLRPATGSGWSWKPPVVTSRPRELLDVGPTASASQQYAQSRQQQDRALRDAFAASNLPMSGANTYYWQSRLRGGDYSPGGTFDSAKFGQDFQSWAASQGSGTSGTAGSSQTGGAIAQNQQMYDEFGNPLPSTTANPLAMAPKMFLNMQPQMFAEGGEARARELLDRLKKPEGAEEQVPGAEEPRSMLERLQRFTSLDTPQDMSLGETVADIGMGFLPGVGTAQGARDFERARREGDMLGMGLSAASMIPVAGGVVRAARKAANVAEEIPGTARQMLDQAAPARAVQTDTPEFKNWFGKSAITKTLEPNGKPRRLYHITPSDFDKFNINQSDATDPLGKGSGPVIFMTDDAEEQMAAHQVGGFGDQFKEGANVMPLYASIQNPLFIDNTSKAAERTRLNLSRGWPSLYTAEDVAKLEEAGYDGVFAVNDDIPNEIVAFRQDQVKSALTNEGSFSGPVITKKDGGEVSFSEQMLEKLKNVGKVARKASRALSDLTPMSEMEDYASRTSTLFYPKETELGGEADAMRHMLFQSELANRYGRLPAAVVGALNEYGLGTLQGQSRAERGMDLENDEKGRDIGLSDMTQDERLREIMEFIDSGKAKTLKESQLGYKNGGEARTEDLIAQMDRIGSTPSRRTPQEDPVKTESRGLLDRLNSAFFENVTKPVVGSLVDTTVGLGDIAQLGTKYLAGRAGVETEPFTPVSGRVQEALGVEGYDPYAPAAIGAQLVAGPMARFRSAAAPALSAATRATVPGSADDMLKRLVGDVAKEGQVYAGSEAGAQIASRLAPDNFGAELVGSMLGGTAVNSAIAVDPRDMSRSAGVSNMASYTPYPFVRGREYPFVGRLDQYVADKVEGTLTKDQFLGQLRGKFRDYEILRAQQALSDLGGKDKVTAADLLTRLEQVYDPADYKVSFYPTSQIPYNSYGWDDPWKRGTSGTSSTGRVGAIVLTRGGMEGEVPSTVPLDPNILNQGLDTLRSLTENRSDSGIALELAQGSSLGRISILRDIVNDLPDSTEQNRLRYYIDNLEDLVGSRQSLAYELDDLENKEFLLNLAVQPSIFDKHMREALERGGAPPEQLLDQAFNAAISSAYASQMQSLPEDYRGMFPQNIDLTGASSYDDKVAAIAAQIGSAPARAKQQLTADIQNEIEWTLTAMEGYMPEFEKLFAPVATKPLPLGSNRGVKIANIHSDIPGNKNPIGFSRFTEVMTTLPGATQPARGVYIHEMQSDLLKPLRRQGVPRSASDDQLRELIQQQRDIEAAKTAQMKALEDSLDPLRQQVTSGAMTYEEFVNSPVYVDANAKLPRLADEESKARLRARSLQKSLDTGPSTRPVDQAFPGMERNSKALQQLLIKNAVAGALDQGYSFVALTAPTQSREAQLYSRLTQNASDVVKDLGEGFRIVDLTLEGNDGPFQTTAIVWGDGSAEGREGVNRVLTRGIPFAKGGEVTSKPDDIKNLLSFLDK